MFRDIDMSLTPDQMGRPVTRQAFFEGLTQAATGGLSVTGPALEHYLGQDGLALPTIPRSPLVDRQVARPALEGVIGDPANTLGGIPGNGGREGFRTSNSPNSVLGGSAIVGTGDAGGFGIVAMGRNNRVFTYNGVEYETDKNGVMTKEARQRFNQNNPDGVAGQSGGYDAAQTAKNAKNRGRGVSEAADARAAHNTGNRAAGHIQGAVYETPRGPITEYPDKKRRGKRD